jgi:hypothetical protein
MIHFTTSGDTNEVYLNPAHVIAVVYIKQGNRWQITAVERHVYTVDEETAVAVRRAVGQYLEGK